MQDDPRGHVSTRVPGDPAFWTFVFGDLFVFALMFFAFAEARGSEPTAFALSHERLNQSLGLLNTMLLLTSSWFVATGVHVARGGAGRRTPAFLAAGVVCAIIFCIVKAFEYSEKFSHGDGPTSSTFFSYYFVLTGIHLVHVIVAIVFMSIVTWRRSQMKVSIEGLENAATFWHLIDLLWIFLFAIIYMVR